MLPDTTFDFRRHAALFSPLRHCALLDCFFFSQMPLLLSIFFFIRQPGRYYHYFFFFLRYLDAIIFDCVAFATPDAAAAYADVIRLFRRFRATRERARAARCHVAIPRLFDFFDIISLRLSRRFDAIDISPLAAASSPCQRYASAADSRFSSLRCCRLPLP